MPLVEISDTIRFPVASIVGFHLLDTVVHAWDVAAALGVAFRPDDELVGATLAIARLIPDGPARRRPTAQFAPALRRRRRPVTGGTGPARPPRAVVRRRRALTPTVWRSSVHQRGSVTRNVAPSPGAVCTSTVPRWAATSAATIESPRPAPPAARVRAGSVR